MQEADESETFRLPTEDFPQATGNKGVESSEGETYCSRRVPSRTRREQRIADSARRRALREAAAAESARPPPSQEHAWDSFYGTNRNSFFKDRHVLRSLLPELMPQEVRDDPKKHVPKLSFREELDCGTAGGGERDVKSGPEGKGEGDALVFVEAGCGVGNALFPVLRASPRSFAYAFDFSAKAIELLKSSEEYHPSRALAFVADLAQPCQYLPRIGRPVDYVVAVWALSALVPGAAMRAAVAGLAGLLRPGGCLLFRDYADGDMRMQAFGRRDEGKVWGDGAEEGIERLYRRGDKTWAYFFQVGEVSRLMKEAGLEIVECRVEERISHNRKNGVVMSRRWLVGRFRKPLTTDAPATP